MATSGAQVVDRVAPAVVAGSVWTASSAVVTTVVVVGQLYVVLPLMPAISAEFGGAAAAQASSVYALSYAVGCVVLGPLSDRVGGRVVAAVAVAGACVATVGVALAPTFALLLAARAVQGFVSAAYTPAILSYVARRVPASSRVPVTSAIISSALAAAVIAQITAQLLGPALGWRGLFWVGAAGMAVCTALTVVSLRPDPRTPSTRLHHTYRALPRTAFQPRLALMFLASLTLLGSFVAIYSTLAVHGPASLRDPGALLALRASALPALLVVAVAAPRLSRVAAGTRLLWSMTAAAVAAAASAAPFGAVWIGGTLLVFVGAIAVAAPAMVGSVTALAPGLEGAAAALYAFAIFAGASLGSAASARVSSAGYPFTAVMAAAVLLVGAVLARLGTTTPKPRGRGDRAAQ